MPKKIQTQDDIIRNLMDVLAGKKEAIAKAEKSNPATNLQFGYYQNGGDVKNIGVVSDISELVMMLGFLYEKEKAFNQAANDLNVSVRFIWRGFSVSEWKSDIENRITKIQISKKQKEVDDLEKRLGELVSPEERRKIELEKLQASITNL